MRGLEAGVLRVAAGPYPADMCVGPALGRLASRHPGLRIELNTGDWRTIVRAQLRDMRLDLAVVELSTWRRTRDCRRNRCPGTAPPSICRVEHPLLREREPSRERTSSIPSSAPSCRPASAGYSTDWPNQAPSTLTPATTCRRSRSTPSRWRPPSCSSSDAIAVAPLGLVADGVQAGRLATLPFREPWLHTDYGFVHLRNRALDPAALAFMAEVRAVEAELTETEQRITDT